MRDTPMGGEINPYFFKGGEARLKNKYLFDNLTA